MRPVTLMFGVGMVLAVVMAVPEQGLAQDDCYRCKDENVDGPHSFTEIGEGAFFACAPYTCHLELKVDRCGEAHEDCGFSETEDFEALAAALEKQDIPEIRAALTRFGDTRVNLPAGSVDILCENRLIARVDVPPHRIRWLAEAEPALVRPTDP